MATTKLVTIDDLAELTDAPGRYDLIRGALIVMPPVSYRHGVLGMRIGRAIADFADEHAPGEVTTSETGFILGRDPDILLAPDVAYVRAERLPPVDEQLGYAEFFPDLAVEVVSPSDSARDVTRKVMEYLRAGVQLVWTVEPDEKLVTVYTPDLKSTVLTGDDVLDGGDVLPGFRLPLPDIFR